MKTRLFTPGPTTVPEETLLELAKPVTYHRSADAKAVLADAQRQLAILAQPVARFANGSDDVVILLRG